jgi:hypothetical protein
MAVEETNEKPVKVDNTSRYMKMAGIALATYYASKKDPYATKGFVEEIKSQQDASELDSRDRAKAAAGTIGTLLANNALERKKRYNEKFENVEVLANLGLNPVFAAAAYQNGSGKALIKIAEKYPKLDLNTLYKKLNDTKITGLTTSDMANVLAGKLTRPDIDYTKFKSQPSGLENFLGVDTNKSFQDTIKSTVSASDTTKTDLDDTTYSTGTSGISKVALSDIGTNLLSQTEKAVTQKENKKQLAQEVGQYMNVDVGSDSVGGYTYESDSEINKNATSNIVNAIDLQIENDIKRNVGSSSPNFKMNRDSLKRKYMIKYFERVRETDKNNKTTTILRPRKNAAGNNFIVNELSQNDDNLLLDKDWTPTGVSATPSKVVTKVVANKQAEIDRLTKVADRLKNQIRSNRQLTSKQRTNALKEIDADLAKDIAKIP